ncbi:epoxide hydrolase family protein [Ornithinimicrobium sufpigmenti]|uniref:epoxide hydrolase family protein n=1 Tax=Ornithinimicrobium sufpigmenti TaxID=2508882 RepID=UPI00192D2D0E|nr:MULTISPECIES: epoxide hydrolase family protein [unclassified Ornithinimicrobium]
MTSFELHVPDREIADLRERLARTRWPDQPHGEPWAYGSDLRYVQDLASYWGQEFDWREQEAALNAFPQDRIEVHGIPLHFLHVPGQGPDPLPLLISHGWPGSVFEFLQVIPRLTDPARFGGDPADAFTVVAPSLPGYGLSFRPGQPRMGIRQITACLADLMVDVLGYRRFGAQGGDWGAYVAATLGTEYEAHLIGLHLNFLPPLVRQPTAPPAPTAEGAAFRERYREWQREESGYATLQGTKPQTLAFALTDSPVGLAAWIVEKMRAWSDHDGNVEDAIGRDVMLANISLYWFTRAIGSSFWPYYAERHGDRPPGESSRPVSVPVGYAEFPAEILRPPRSVAELSYRDIRRWTTMPRGGHFAALEQPAALAAEVAAFFRPLR